MPVFYNPFGHLVARDMWDILEAYYPVLRRGLIASGGLTTLLNLGPGIRGCLIGIGTYADPCDIDIILDGVTYNWGFIPPGQTIPLVAAFASTCVVEFISGDPANELGWITYRRL